MKFKLWTSIVLVSLFLFGCSASDIPKEEVEEKEVVETDQVNEGNKAVNFEFVDYDGNVIKLEDLKGDKVYLKFWASWCPICNDGLPELDELFTKEKDYIVYSVVTPNANGEKSIDDFKEWFKQDDYPNIVVLFDENGKFSRNLGVLSVPTSVYIGSDGVLIKSAPGHSNNEDIETFIKTFE
jgi:thiol-disulfide isomerase/thioredoxin